jgi:hypothetical protein
MCWICRTVLIGLLWCVGGPGLTAAAQQPAAPAPVELVSLDFPRDAAVGAEFTVTATVRSRLPRLTLVNLRLAYTNVQLLAPAAEQLFFLEGNATHSIRWRVKRTGAEAGQIVTGMTLLTPGRPGAETAPFAVPAPDLTALRQVWVGEWTSPDSRFDAEMRLTLTADGRVDGQLAWTLRKSPRPEDQAKLGFTGTEHVWGTYDPRSRTLVLEGYRRDDPHQILGLDKYRLVLADGGQVIGGITWDHATWQGKFNLTSKSSR